MANTLQEYIVQYGITEIYYQGSEGAWSHQACLDCMPQIKARSCVDFETAIEQAEANPNSLAMIPVENSIAGRVADIHFLLPKTKLYIIGEHFVPIHHHLLGVKGAVLADIKEARSHVHAIGQCRVSLRKLGIKPVIDTDTAGCAKKVAQNQDKSTAAIASPAAAAFYNLDILSDDITDKEQNTTRFIILGSQALELKVKDQKTLTTFIARTKDVPSALYKILGGFATNGVNLMRLESYIHYADNRAEFLIDAEGHFGQRNFDFAYDELQYFSQEIKLFGSYRQSPWRKTNS